MKWELIYTANGESEAVVIKSALIAEGIEYKETKESIGRLYAISMNGLGEVKIYVPENRAEDAKELLKDLKS